jgi:hypothetical protein
MNRKEKFILALALAAASCLVALGVCPGGGVAGSDS